MEILVLYPCGYNGDSGFSFTECDEQSIMQFPRQAECVVIPELMALGQFGHGAYHLAYGAAWIDF